MPGFCSTYDPVSELPKQVLFAQHSRSQRFEVVAPHVKLEFAHVFIARHRNVHPCWLQAAVTLWHEFIA